MIAVTKLDPTRTATLRRAFRARIRRGYARLKGSIAKLVGHEDVFGLDAIRNAFCPTGEGGGHDNSCSSDGIKEIENTDWYVEHEFKYGDRTYSVRATVGEQPGYWTVYFISGREGYARETEITGDVGEKAVGAMRRVGKCVDKFIEDRKPQSFRFDANEGEQSRVKLYDRVAETLAKRHGYRLTRTRRDEGTVDYQLDKLPTHNTHLSFELIWNERWRFHTDKAKIDAFVAWLRQQNPSISEAQAWQQYIEGGFRKGAGRAYDDVMKRRPKLETEDFYRGGARQFLHDSFAQPVAQEKLELLVGRTFTDLKGVDDQMATVMARTLADGLTRGVGAREMAALLNDRVDKIGVARSELIARTELIRAHAEGQLVGMRALGVKRVGADVEWSTAGDESVCSECSSMEGSTYTLDDAEGMIPLHPNCRCAWIPADDAVENASFFEACDRDEKGRCKPGSGGLGTRVADRIGVKGAAKAVKWSFGSSHIKDASLELSKQIVSRLPEHVRGPVQKFAELAGTAASPLSAARRASQKFAERVSKERGLNEEQSKRLHGMLSSIDTASYRPLSYLPGGLAFRAVPPATAGYLLYSTATNPMAVFRAAKGAVSDGWAKVKGKFVRNADIGHQLVDALEAHDYDDWYIALYHAALSETDDAEDAIQLANAVYDSHKLTANMERDALGRFTSLRGISDAFQELSYDEIVEHVQDHFSTKSKAESMAALSTLGLTASSKKGAVEAAVRTIHDRKASSEWISEIGAKPLPVQKQTALPFDVRLPAPGGDRGAAGEVSDMMAEFAKRDAARNAFCPTGPGGGVDPHCGKGGVSLGAAKVTELQRKRIAFLNPDGIKGGVLRLPKAVDEQTGAVDAIKAANPGVRVELVSFKGKLQVLGLRGAPPERVERVEKLLPPLPAGDAETDLLNSPIVTKKDLGGGANGSYKLTLSTGRQCVWKPANGEADYLRANVPAGEYYKREAAAFDVAKAIGLEDMVPATVVRSIDGKVGSLQDWVPHAQVAAEAMGNIYDGQKDRDRAAAFDYLIYNTDRHRGNWMLQGGKLKLIDHGLAFPTKGGSFRSNLAWNASESHERVPDEVASWDREKVRAAVSQHLSGAAVALTMQRFDKLRENVGKPFSGIIPGKKFV